MIGPLLLAAWLVLLSSIAVLYRALIVFEHPLTMPAPSADDGEEHSRWSQAWKRVNSFTFLVHAAGCLFCAAVVLLIAHFAATEGSVAMAPGTSEVETAGKSLGNGTWGLTAG